MYADYREPSIIEDIFGRTWDRTTMRMEPIRRFTFVHGNKMKVQVITLGATITSLHVPDKRGILEDIVLGFDTIDGYGDCPTNPYFGTTVGRVTNRVNHSHFRIYGKRFKVSKNLRDMQALQGGFIGLNDVIWSVLDIQQETRTLKLQCVSPHIENGIPGQITTTVTFSLESENCFHIRLTANSTLATPVNLTNHTYFNLKGHGAGKNALYNTLIYINADYVLDADYDGMPSGRVQSVSGTPYDFKQLKELGPQMMQLNNEGFDDNYCINMDENAIKVVAKAVCPISGRYLELSSDQPGLQFYTGNSLPNMSEMEDPIVGKDDKKYMRHGAFCFETHRFSNGINHPNFPSIVLEPDTEYEHNIVYKFGVVKNNGSATDYSAKTGQQQSKRW